MVCRWTAVTGIRGPPWDILPLSEPGREVAQPESLWKSAESVREVHGDGWVVEKSPGSAAAGTLKILTAGAHPDLQLTRRLRGVVRGAVSDDLRRRAEYSTDASNYRVVPAVVVEPMDLDDVLATLAVSRETGVAVTSRGGGTSVAGNAIGAGIVIDFARHLDPDRRDRFGRSDRTDPARCRPGRSATTACPAGPAVRAGPVDAGPRDPGRDDRQQRLRAARRGLWPHRRQRPGADHRGRVWAAGWTPGRDRPQFRVCPI